MSKYYTIKITGGTSPGPYTVFFNQIGPQSNIATIYDSNPPILATNLFWSDLTNGSGINVEVPDDTSTIYLYNEYCESGSTLIPTNTIIYKDFCFVYYPSVGGANFASTLSFSQTSLDTNNLPIWTCDTDISIIISWDSINLVWVMNGFNLIEGNIIITSQSPQNSNPPKNWVMVGSELPYTIKITEGGCVSEKKSTFPVSINQPSCFCDGSIIFNVNLDNPPFSYSIDNGVTYSSSPIFNKLCSGIYILSVVNSIGDTFSKTITLDKPVMSTTYTITLDTTTSVPVSNEISLVNNYDTTITISPSLPDGTTITFDFIHTNSFYSSPNSGTSVLTTGTVLSKNSSVVTYNSVVTGNTQSVNTTPGCQLDFIYQSTINEVWNSVTMNNSDSITISTTTRVDKTTTGLCVVGYSNDTYSIVNATINGCDCCSIIVNT
jgi:hypothetical protein